MVKLIIGGSTGLVGTELVREGLANPSITTIVGLSRRETPVPEGAPHGEKLRSVVVDDFCNYSDEAKAALEDADACIWTIAITPSKAKEISWDETVRICRDYALAGLDAVAAAPRKQSAPLRFVYISGHFTLRKGDEIPEGLKMYGLGDMAVMRGELEASILDFAQASGGRVESLIAKPGFMAAPGRTPPPVPGLPTVQLRDVVAALLDQALNGFEKDKMWSEDITRIGQRALGQSS
jgi:nucleoside-diphosphate-sugar epimerase